MTPDKRTVSAILRVMGKGDAPAFQTYHRVLNRAQWSALQASRILLLQLVDSFVPSGLLLIGVDETIEQR